MLPLSGSQKYANFLGGNAFTGYVQRAGAAFFLRFTTCHVYIWVLRLNEKKEFFVQLTLTNSKSKLFIYENTPFLRGLSLFFFCSS
jgi:hypothetical protein